jgi:hypothetical protein
MLQCQLQLWIHNFLQILEYPSSDSCESARLPPAVDWRTNFYRYFKVKASHTRCVSFVFDVPTLRQKEQTSERARYRMRE